MGKWFEESRLCNRPNYPKKLIRTIEENDLWKFDGSKKPMKRKKSKLKDVHTVERDINIHFKNIFLSKRSTKINNLKTIN